jgi:hypothetical protein
VRSGPVGRRVALTVSAVLLTACSGGPEGPEDPAGSPPSDIRLELSFTQVIPQEGSERGLLRVTNVGDEPLAVDSVGLDWPGYGSRFDQPKDVSIEPDSTLDLKITLPEPECAETEEPVVALLSTDHGDVRQELGRNGQLYVRRLWATQCFQRRLHEQVSLRYVDRWRPRGSGQGSSVVGALRLERRRGSAEVRVVSVRGSVLYDLGLPGNRVLEPDDEVAVVPIEILPGNRCDEHAIGQATAPFDFRLNVRIGTAPVGGLDLAPPPNGQAAAGAMLQRACAAATE